MNPQTDEKSIREFNIDMGDSPVACGGKYRSRSFYRVGIKASSRHRRYNRPIRHWFFGRRLAIAPKMTAAWILPIGGNQPDVWAGEKCLGPTARGGRYRPMTKEFRHMNKDTFRVVTRGADGEIRIRDYDSAEDLLKRHSQVGVDDCSTDLGLRGLPVFRGLIGPMPEGKNVIRYESPEVFETLTKDWSAAKPARRRTRRPSPAPTTPATP
jgi:hypothetical protein